MSQTVAKGNVSNQGVLYIAGGAQFVEEAIASAGSLKRHNPRLHATLFADRKVCADNTGLDSARVIEFRHQRAKVDYLPESPYERTLYLDSDTEVRHDLTEMFDLLDRFDVAMTHDFARKRAQWARLIPEYAQIPYSFPEFNGGVILYAGSDAAYNFLSLWREYFERYRETTRGWDQASLRIAAWRSEARIHTLPIEFNVRSMSNRWRARKLVASGEEPDLLEPRIWHWRGVHRRRGLRGWLNPGRRPYRY